MIFEEGGKGSLWRERKEGMQWNLFIFRASKMFNLLGVSWLLGEELSGYSKRVTLHSFNKNVAWLEILAAEPPRTNIWKVSNDHSTLNFLSNTKPLNSKIWNVYLWKDKIFVHVCSKAIIMKIFNVDSVSFLEFLEIFTSIFFFSLIQVLELLKDYGDHSTHYGHLQISY